MCKPTQVGNKGSMEMFFENNSVIIIPTTTIYDINFNAPSSVTSKTYLGISDLIAYIHI